MPLALQLPDHVVGEDHEIEGFSRLHALGRIDAAHRLDGDGPACRRPISRASSARTWRVAIEDMPVIVEPWFLQRLADL